VSRPRLDLGRAGCNVGNGSVMPRRTLKIVLIKPSHYDNDGYVIQWWRSGIPSNSLASVYGLLRKCAASPSNQFPRAFADRIPKTYGAPVPAAVDGWCPDSEVRAHSRPIRMRTSESKDTSVDLVQMSASFLPRVLTCGF